MVRIGTGSLNSFLHVLTQHRTAQKARPSGNKASSHRICVMAQVTPIGIAIGIGVSKTYNENDRVALGFEGGFNSISAGTVRHTLVYLCAVHVQLQVTRITTISTTVRVKTASRNAVHDS